MMSPEDSRRAAVVMTTTTLFDEGDFTDDDLETEEAFQARLKRDAELEAKASALSAALRKVTRISDLPPDMMKLFLEAERAVPQETKG